MMDERTILKNRLSTLWDFVENNRGSACRVSCYEDPERELDRPVGLKIVANSSLWIAANGHDDSIEIGDRAQLLLVESNAIETAATGRWGDLNGRSIASACLLTNQRGYTDGLQICFSEPNNGFIFTQFLTIASTLSLKTSAVGSVSSPPSSQQMTIVESIDGLKRTLEILDQAVDEPATLSNVLYQCIGSAIVGVVLVFGKRALRIHIVETELQVEMLSGIPNASETAGSKAVWSDLLGSRIMWLWCLTNAAGYIAGIQAEFWESSGRGPVGVRQIIANNEELNVLSV